eukprot:33331-Amphidinium_carterae.1
MSTKSERNATRDTLRAIHTCATERGASELCVQSATSFAVLRQEATKEADQQCNCCHGVGKRRVSPRPDIKLLEPPDCFQHTVCLHPPFLKSTF